MLLATEEGARKHVMPSPLIYVVDDQASFTTVSEAVLREAGFRFKTFLNPNEAFGAFSSARKKPDILIADYGMEYMNGLELTQRCQSLHPTLKTILVSGAVDSETIPNFPFHVDRFLHKPITVDGLLNAISEVLNS